MYESHWQLNLKPFEPTGELPWYYPSEVHQGALLKLRYAIESRRGAALLCGASGLGKSMLVRTLQRQLGERYAPFAQLIFPQMPARELLAYIAHELGGAVGDSANLSIEESIRRLQRVLGETTAAGRHAVLAIDESHLLADAATLEAVRLLLNLNAEGAAALTVLLVGQPPLLSVLDRQHGLEERLSVKVLLRPFTIDETISYVSHRLAAAGARFEIFTAEALVQIHQLTDGNPRRINRLCDLVLLIGYAEERHVIGPEQVEAVSSELVTISPE